MPSLASFIFWGAFLVIPALVLILLPRLLSGREGSVDLRPETNRWFRPGAILRGQSISLVSYSELTKDSYLATLTPKVRRFQGMSDAEFAEKTSLVQALGGHRSLVDNVAIHQNFAGAEFGKVIGGVGAAISGAGRRGHVELSVWLDDANNSSAVEKEAITLAAGHWLGQRFRVLMVVPADNVQRLALLDAMGADVIDHLNVARSDGSVVESKVFELAAPL